MSDAQLSFSISCRKTDVFQAAGHIIFHSPQYYFGALISNLVFLLVHAYELSLLWVLAGLAVYLPLAPVMLARSIMKTPGALDPTTFTFTDGGLAVENQHAKVIMDWTLVKAATESKSTVYIKYGRGGSLFIPKNRTTADKLALLRAILRAHIPYNGA